VENEVDRGLIRRISDESGQKIGVIRAALEMVSEEISAAFGTESTAYFRTEGSAGLSTTGLAGTLQVAPGVELDIRPKFLAPNAKDWRKDFAAALSVSLAGRLLPKRKVATDFDRHAQFARLVATEWLQSYRKHSGAIIRTYRRRAIREIELVGQVDWSRLSDLDERGFPQSKVVFGRDNRHNTLMAEAALHLREQLADPSLRDGLELAAAQLMRDGRAPSRSAPGSLPTRSRRWTDLIELSHDILSERTPHFREGIRTTSGYVFRTWTVWQDLCEVALRAHDEWSVDAQPPLRIGSRGSKDFHVTPDLLVRIPGVKRPVIVDAKYKKRGDDSVITNSTDAYEALAFLRAANSRTAVLLYPEDAEETLDLVVGFVRIVEVISVGKNRIVAAKVNTRDLGATKGVELFATTIAEGVRQIVDDL